MKAIVLIAAFCLAAWVAPAQSAALDKAVSPIRKVVNLLKKMQEETEREGKQEAELFEKFMCYCKGSNQDLLTAEANGETKIAQLTAQIKKETAEKTQAAQELKGHTSDKATATKDLSDSTALREREASEHAANVADLKTNLGAVSSAIPALEKGLSGAAFMQLPVASRLTSVLDSFQFSDAKDRQRLLAFVQSSDGEQAPSDQIVGILKTMKDSMQASIKEAEGEEATAVETFAELKASKTDEIGLAAEAMAAKTERGGALAVSISAAKDDLEDTEDELANTKKFIVSLESECKTKQADWDERQKVRQDEITSIGEAIKILDDDDARDLLSKAVPKTNPEAGVGFLQRTDRRASSVMRAQAVLAAAAEKHHDTPLKILLFTVNSQIRQMHRGGSTGRFDKVIEMIDSMVELLGKNQAEDDHQKDWCRDEFVKSAREEAAETRNLEKANVEISEKADAILNEEEEIAMLEQEIKDLDKSVALATEQRKEEHAAYTTHVEMTSAAKSLVNKALNRLNKFYSPTEYVAPPTTPPPSIYGLLQEEPPKTFGKTYEKSQKSGGALALLKMIIHELDSDLQESEHNEKSAQKDYATIMSESQETRATDSQSITDKESLKAELQIKLEKWNERKRSTAEELSLVKKYIGQLHTQCDFLQANYDERKEARETETGSLTEAKALLKGMR